jgi:hypothetical protein
VFYLLCLLAYAFTVPITFLTQAHIGTGIYTQVISKVRTLPRHHLVLLPHPRTNLPYMLAVPAGSMHAASTPRCTQRQQYRSHS